MLCKVVPTTEEALTALLRQSTIQALAFYGIDLGQALGLYPSLKSGGWLTPPEPAEQPSAVVGTVSRTETMRALATAAGLTGIEVVAVDGGFFRLDRLRRH